MTESEQTFQMVPDPQGKIVGVLAGVEYITAKEAETLIAENAVLRSEVERLKAASVAWCEVEKKL